MGKPLGRIGALSNMSCAGIVMAFRGHGLGNRFSSHMQNTSSSILALERYLIWPLSISCGRVVLSQVRCLAEVVGQDRRGARAML